MSQSCKNNKGVKGNMKNILLDTINDNTNLGQILSTYALYKTIEKLA